MDRNVSTISREVGVLDRGLQNIFKNATSETITARETVNYHESRLASRSALARWWTEDAGLSRLAIAKSYLRITRTMSTGTLEALRVAYTYTAF